MYYKLEGKNPVECINVLVWAEWFETSGEQRIVAQAELGEYFISTAFLGVHLKHLEHDGKPLLFETMIFKDGKATGDVIRSSTWDAAEAAQQSALKWVQKQPSGAIADFIKKGRTMQKAVDYVLAKYASDPASQHKQNDAE